MYTICVFIISILFNTITTNTDSLNRFEMRFFLVYSVTDIDSKLCSSSYFYCTLPNGHENDFGNSCH